MTGFTPSARGSHRGTWRRFFGLPAAERHVVVRCCVLLARLLPIGLLGAPVAAYRPIWEWPGR